MPVRSTSTWKPPDLVLFPWVLLQNTDCAEACVIFAVVDVERGFSLSCFLDIIAANSVFELEKKLRCKKLHEDN